LAIRPSQSNGAADYRRRGLPTPLDLHNKFPLLKPAIIGVGRDQGGKGASCGLKSLVKSAIIPSNSVPEHYDALP
jgi:hypothetical protein